jgi:isopropylmalate/homocitrate/citramalate synthase
MKKTLNNILQKSPMIALAENDIDTNIYLEDWSNGMRNSLSMCFNFRIFVSTCQRVLLLDTLGVLIPSHTFEFISKLLQNIQTFILISMRTMIMI